MNMRVAAALVLICDGDPDVRAALRIQLELEGFRVLEAEDGHRGYVLSVGFTPDLILTELAIAGLAGPALIRKLRAVPTTSRIPIVVLSSGTGDRLAALQDGATDFISKPCDAHQLCIRLWDLISRERREGSGATPPYHSCFVSYCDSDEKFVARLHRDLLLASIQCWKWKENARLGAGLWNEIDQAIQDHGKVVLVASRTSLNSPAVKREIERALRIEDETNRDVLLPITLDDFIFNEWQGGRRADVLGKMVADARGWEESPAKYDELRERLIRDLRLP